MYGFYETLSRFDASQVEKIEALSPTEKGKILMTIEDAANYSGVPKSEWKRLINEKKLTTLVLDADTPMIYFSQVQNVKHWWNEYQKTKVGE